MENIEILLDKEKNCGHLLYGGRYDRYSHRKRNPCHDGRNTEQPAGLQICGVTNGYGATSFTELHRALHKNILIWRQQRLCDLYG